MCDSNRCKRRSKQHSRGTPTPPWLTSLVWTQCPCGVDSLVPCHHRSQRAHAISLCPSPPPSPPLSYLVVEAPEAIAYAQNVALRHTIVGQLVHKALWIQVYVNVCVCLPRGGTHVSTYTKREGAQQTSHFDKSVCPMMMCVVAEHLCGNTNTNTHTSMWWCCEQTHTVAVTTHTNPYPHLCPDPPPPVTHLSPPSLPPCPPPPSSHRHDVVESWAQPSTRHNCRCGVARVVVDCLARPRPDGPGGQRGGQLLQGRLHPVDMGA